MLEAANNVLFWLLLFIIAVAYWRSEYKKEQEARKAKQAKEMEQLKQKERQLYVDALNDWAESPTPDDKPHKHVSS